MTKNKEVPVYIVVKRGGMQNRIVETIESVWRIGATSEKEAIKYAKEKLDKTGGYRVVQKSESEKMSRGLVVRGRYLYSDHMDKKPSLN